MARTEDGDGNGTTAKTTTIDGTEVLNDGNSPNFNHWDHLPFGFSGSGGNGDILAWNGNPTTPMRYLELASVLPDAFGLRILLHRT